MKRHIINILLSALIATAIFSSCNDDGFLSSDNVRLSFSTDTLMFDTIFTTIGSTTKSFRVINPHNRAIQISSIELAGGNSSPYRLNIDGVMSNNLKNVELPARDSIYIFVEVTVDPNESNQPLIVKDSIIFITNSRMQDIKLVAWGQDFIPIREEYIQTTTWTDEKPYLIYNIAVVDTGHVLTIEPGARIHFNNDAMLVAIGAIQAMGTPEKPITFTTDRLESMYYDIPDMWYGIILFPNDMINVFDYVEIRNAKIGLQVGTLEYEGSAQAIINNTKIEHISYYGILAIKSVIEASNLLVADCGFYGVALQLGGHYHFNHTTIANYWSSFSYRKTPSVLISNRLFYEDKDTKTEYVSDLLQATWRNSIIWGNTDNEIIFDFNDEFLSNYEFDHCLVKVNDSIFNIHQDNFTSTMRNISPEFVDYREFNYMPGENSPARNAGNREYAEWIPFDLYNVFRLNNSLPDIGAIQYVKEEGEEE